MMGSDSKDVRRQRAKLGIAVLLIAAAGGVVWYQVGGESAAATAAHQRVLMCNECQGTFPHDLVEDEIQPIECDVCGKQAAYSPEECYWAKGADGSWQGKIEPTYVILKSRMDPTSSEKTLCPDCGKVVVGHNKATNMPSEELMSAARAAAGG